MVRSVVESVMETVAEKSSESLDKAKMAEIISKKVA